MDGQELAHYPGEEGRYLNSLLTNFRQHLLRLRDDLLPNGERLTEFPRIWILALSKADLLPDWDVDTFRDTVILGATDALENLRSAISDLIDAPNALSFGDDFILLSSAEFQLSTDGSAPVEIDVTKQVGVNLVLPVASLLPLQRRVQWSERMAIPRKVLETLADGAEELAEGLTAGRFAGVENLIAKLPRWGDRARLALRALQAATEIAGPRLREMNARAREQHDYLRATLTQFKIDLEQGVQDRVLRTPK